MKKLTALKPHYYGRQLEVGDEYEADDKHATYLVLLGQARSTQAIKEEQKTKRQYQRRDMEAES